MLFRSILAYSTKFDKAKSKTCLTTTKHITELTNYKKNNTNSKSFNFGVNRKVSKITTKQNIIGQSIKNYYISHIRKIEYKQEKLITKSLEVPRLNKLRIDLNSVNTPKDLLILAKQVKAEAERLHKTNPALNCFYTSNTKAIIIQNNGDIYNGDMVQEYKQGIGIELYSDGRIYKGNWKKGEPNGSGIYKTNFGFTIIGQFDKELNVISSSAKLHVKN